MIVQIIRRLPAAAAMLTLMLAFTPGIAGTVCRGIYIAGLQDAAERGKAAVGEPTNDSLNMRIYAERVPMGWYYQTNLVIAGAPFPAKIISERPLTLRVVVANMLRKPLASALTRPLVVAGATLFDNDASVQFASVE